MDEALAIANGTQYALTGGLISRSPATIARVRREFLVGNLYINRGTTGALVERQAFGGFKMSGVGSKAGGPGLPGAVHGLRLGGGRGGGDWRRRRHSGATSAASEPKLASRTRRRARSARAAHERHRPSRRRTRHPQGHVHGRARRGVWRAQPASCGRTAASSRPGCSKKVRSAAPTRCGRQRRKSRKRRTTSSASPR